MASASVVDIQSGVRSNAVINTRMLLISSQWEDHIRDQY